MVSIRNTTCKIVDRSRSLLKIREVSVPEGAVSFDYVSVPESTKYTEIFTFKDANNLRLVQQKNKVDRLTKEKEVQKRVYEYTKRDNSKSKITDINQTTISPNGEEKHETWRFYYPKDKSTVRFSRKSEEKNVDNYLHSDGVIVDKNGLNIRPISTAEYVDKRKDIDDNHFVDSPWTMKQTITTKERCATDSVQECTVVGIYGDKGLTLNHLNPHRPENRNFNKIEKALLDQLEQQGKNAKAFVLGSCESDFESDKQYLNIIDLLATRGVKYSRFKTGDSVLYGPMHFDTKITSENSKKYKFGTASPYEWELGQHIIYDNGELQIANVVIDSELKKGNTDPESLIKKSFYRIYR